MAKQTQNSGSNAETDREPLRSARNDDPAREPRATQDRLYQDMTDEQRLELFKAHMTDSILPLPKAPPGWHYIYLSTTNQYDTIQTRRSWGYLPVPPEEVPGFDLEANVITEGSYSGAIGVKEMVLFKIKDELYQGMMKHLHHDLPNEEATKLLNLTKNPDLSAAGVHGQHNVRRDVGDGEAAIEEEILKRRAAPRRFG